MRVAEVVVHNYKSICSEVDECRLNLDEKITYLIGANESGKTNLLEVMEKFSLGGFEEADIPYMSPSCDIPDIPNDLKMISVKYAIEDKDTDNLSKIDTPLTKAKEITLTRNFKGEPYISYPDYKGESELKDALAHLQRDCQHFAITFRKYVKEYKRINKASASSTNSALRRLSSLLSQIDSLTQSFDKLKITVARAKVKRLHKAIMNLANPLESFSNEVIKPLEQITTTINKLPRYDLAGDVSQKLWKLVPQFAFVPADPDLWLKGEYLVDHIISRPKNDEQLLSIRRLLQLSGLENLGATRKLGKVRQTVALETASKKITDLLKTVWGQEKDIQIKLMWGPEGNKKLLVMVQTAGHRGYPNERSRGFRWFLEFYLMYAAALHHDVVLLFEEPGIHLHPDAQKDLKRIMREKVAAESQIVYTTHLPDMYDAAYPEGCRAVQKEGGVTKIESRYSPEHQRTTWEVAMKALGVTEPVLRMCNKNIIAEGPTDRVYLQTFARLLAPNEPSIGVIASGLIHIFQAERASAIPGIIPFFFQPGVKCVVLLDNDQAGRNTRDKISQQFKIPEEVLGIVMTNDITNIESELGTGDHALEDLFGVGYYAKLVTSWLKNGKLSEKDFKNGNLIASQAAVVVKRKFKKDLKKYEIAWHFHDLVQYEEKVPDEVITRFKHLLLKLVAFFNSAKGEVRQGTDTH